MLRTTFSAVASRRRGPLLGLAILGPMRTAIAPYRTLVVTGCRRLKILPGIYLQNGADRGIIWYLHWAAQVENLTLGEASPAHASHN
ncbi:MAG: hypothetical protein B6D36_16285 [Planctomycetes bacterium UTPLA1]|nr:MAG: hypothetical protein B6D36_16285 [Planctomycetes bacterium UTPLA1]